MKFLFVEYWIWYPVVCVFCAFHVALNCFLPAVNFFKEVPLGLILNVFVSVPVYAPFPVIVTVAIPTFLLFLYVIE